MISSEVAIRSFKFTQIYILDMDCAGSKFFFSSSLVMLMPQKKSEILSPDDEILSGRKKDWIAVKSEAFLLRSFSHC